MTAGKSLKIAMVLRSFSPNGGLELYALKLVEGLLADGHRVTVIAESDESKLRHQNLNVSLFPPATRGAGKADKLDHYYQATSALLAQLTAKDGAFDIVHSHHFPVSPVDVVTFHNHTAGRLSQVGYPWEKLLNNAKLTLTEAYKKRDFYDAKLAREAKLRIFVGAVMRADFYDAYNLQSSLPCAVAHPGAEAKADGPQLKMSPGEGEAGPFKFLFVGKGFRKKGLDTLLQACGILKGRGRDFRLEIAGMRVSAVRNLQLGMMDLADKVTYLGFRRDMPDVFSGAQALILPSKVEPFGMAPIEGMNYGLVPIVSRVCGVAEVLTDGEDALILQNHLSAEELAGLMERLIVDRELYNRLRARALQSADRLNWRGTVDATESAYEQVLKQELKNE